MASSTAFQLYLPPRPSLLEISTVGWPSIKDYIRTGRLGEGGCAIVFRAKHRQTGKEVAVKKIERTNDDTHIAGELSILQTTKHENLIYLHEFLWSENNFYFILELANRGSLMDRCSMRDSEARMFFRQIISGIAYLHERKIAHLDLKPDNILIHKIDGREVAKITDFGISKINGEVVDQHEGTPEYMPPEVHLEIIFNGLQADMWSLGVTLYVMLTGMLPFCGKHSEDSAGLQQSILSAQYTVPNILTVDTKCLLQKLLQFDPCQRHCVEVLMKEDKWLMAD